MWINVIFSISNKFKKISNLHPAKNSIFPPLCFQAVKPGKPFIL